MTEVFLFLRQGWKKVWKQNIVWLFSALPLFSGLILAGQTTGNANLRWSLLYLARSLVSIILLLASIIGVPYLVYSFSVGKPVTLRETFSATKKFARRVLGACCLVILVSLPCAFVTLLALSRIPATQSLQSSDAIVFISIPLLLFSAVWDFALFGLFANDWGVWQSLKEAWTLFTAHFRVLATLGLIMVLVFRIYEAASGALTVLIQSGFETTALSALNYINPSTTLRNSVLFVVISGMGQMVLTLLRASVFASAYLRYSGVKTSLVTKR